VALNILNGSPTASGLGVSRLLTLNADATARNFGRRTRAIRGPARRTYRFIAQ